MTAASSTVTAVPSVFLEAPRGGGCQRMPWHQRPQQPHPRQRGHAEDGGVLGNEVNKIKFGKFGKCDEWATKPLLPSQQTPLQNMDSKRCYIEVGFRQILFMQTKLNKAPFPYEDLISH